MKSYTDVEESKVLSQILPIESADMWFHPYPNDEDWYDVPNIGNADLKYNQLPCWTLSALLDIIPDGQVNRMMSNGKWMAVSWTPGHDFITKDYDSAVDACYALILKLHERKLL